MSFSNFKNVEQVLKKYPHQYLRASFLPQELTLTPPDWFVEETQFALSTQTEIENEAFFRENFIYPLMKLVWRNHLQLKLWINQSLFFNDELSGELDYMLSYWPKETVIESFITRPMLAVVEAKQQNFIRGWGQCLAEMIACQKLNDQPDQTVFGIVSTGLTWEFAKLQRQIFTKDLYTYSISDLPRLLGLLDFVMTECEKELQLYNH